MGVGDNLLHPNFCLQISLFFEVVYTMTKKLEQSKKITKELEDKILKYQDKFETMENFVDIVRKMPGMYIGPIGNQGFLNMIREILQNALDEFLRSC